MFQKAIFLIAEELKATQKMNFLVIQDKASQPIRSCSFP